ncbi:MAG: hypothetical protein AAF959_29920 [Cyanobacteria bacterium P01_D01_bin.56]
MSYTTDKTSIVYRQGLAELGLSKAYTAQGFGSLKFYRCPLAKGLEYRGQRMKWLEDKFTILG